MKNYDLHTHTIYSDGELTPKQLVEKAKKMNLKYLAITDHNNIEGSKIACSLNDDDITIIPAVEMEGEYDNGKLHILGYNIDLNNENINYTFNLMRKQRKNRIIAIIQELAQNNFVFPEYEINNILYKIGDIGKLQIAKLLVKYEYAENVKDAFDYILNDDHIKLPEKNYTLSKENIIEVIKEAGGIPVLAHYKTLNLNGDDLKLFIEELISLGLMGIETEHSCFDQEKYKIAKQIASEYHLLETGGSDFHGENIKNNIRLADWYHEKTNENVCTMITFLEKNQKIKKI